MAIADVLANTYIDPALDVTAIQQILSVLYAQSSTARSMLDRISTSSPLTINYSSGDFQGLIGQYVVDIDPAALTNLSYITPNGKAVAYPLILALAHEMVHAILGLSDFPQSAPDFAGPTVDHTNLIHEELYYADRLSYGGAGSSPYIVAGTQYTNGATIDAAIFTTAGSYNVDTQGHSTNSRDLLIGTNIANNFFGGSGNDFLYGNGGDDILDGGSDDDLLVGGADNDTYLLHSTNNGQTTIRDNTGTLKLDGSVFGGYAIKNNGSDNIWTIGNYTAAFATGTNTLQLTNLSDGANNIFLENFQNGDYGITLKQNDGTPGGSGVGGNPPVQGDDATDSGMIHPTHVFVQYTYSFQSMTYTNVNGLSPQATQDDFYNHELQNFSHTADPGRYSIGDTSAGYIQAVAYDGYYALNIYGGYDPVYTGITYTVAVGTITNIIDASSGISPLNGGTISTTTTGTLYSSSATHDATYWAYLDNYSGTLPPVDLLDLNGDGIADNGTMANAGTTGIDNQQNTLLSTDASETLTGGAGGLNNFVFKGDFGNDLVSGGGHLIINGSLDQGAAINDGAGHLLYQGYAASGPTPGYVNYNLTQTTAGLVISKAIYDPADPTGHTLLPQANTVTLTDYSPTQTYGITGIAFTVNGTSGDDVLIGGTAGDTIFGLAGNDTISGDTGNDTLYGGDGDDVIDGGLGADIIDGGAGNNTVTYAAPYDAVSVNLTTNVNSGGYATGDSLVNIQNVIGSMYNDTIVGNTTDNILTGGGGVDTLKGMGGEDTYRLSTTDSVTTIYNGLDSNAGTSGTLSEAFASDHLWFAQTGDDLTISVLGTYKNAVIKDWYAGSATSWQQLDEVIGSDNLKIDASIQTLVQAMATFGASNSGFTSPSTTHTSVTDSSYYGAVATAYANAWHA